MAWQRRGGAAAAAVGPSGPPSAQPRLNHTALRERYAVAGREPVTIHPQDAQARGIVDGDLVRVWNARGQVLAGAVVTEGIRPGGDLPA